MLSPQKASAFGAWLFGRFGPHMSKHRHVLANLRMVCPDCDAATIQAYARGVWRNLGSMTAEYPRLAALMGRGDEARYEIIIKNQDPGFLSG